MSFNINAKVVLSGPERLDKIRNNIKKKLGNLNVPLTIDVGKGTQSALTSLNAQAKTLQNSMTALQNATNKVNNSYNKYNKNTKNSANSSKNLAQATNAVSNSFDKTAKSASNASSQVEKFGKDAALAIRRFSAFTLATGAVFGFVQAIRVGVTESAAFEKELSRLTQVTGQSSKGLSSLAKQVKELSSEFGTSKIEIAEVAVILGQTGKSIQDIQRALTPLVKTDLGATFKDLKSTTEGLVAAQAQFKISSKDTERILGSLNAIAKKFAVESDDLVSVIRRAGGVFAEANQNQRLYAKGSDIASKGVSDQIKSFNQLLGIFTSVRSQTRETADTIATGLRTIFSRLQRPTTIKFLEQYGVQLKVTKKDIEEFKKSADNLSLPALRDLENSEGDFVGVSEAIKRIGKAAQGLNNLQLSKLVEELGGIRQVGKIIPALRNTNKALEATQIGLKGVNSVTEDADIAVQTLSTRVDKLSSSFKNLVDNAFQSDSIKGLTSGLITIAETLVSVADSARPLIPLLTTIVGTSLTKAGFSFFKGFKKEFSNATGGISGSVGSKLGGSLSSSSSSSSSSSKTTVRVDPALLNATRDNTKALRELTAILRGKRGSGGGGDSKGGPSGGSGGKRGPKGGSGGGGRGSGGGDSGPILDATLVDPRLPLPRGAKQFDLRGGVTSLPPKKGSSISPVKPNPNFDLGGQIRKEAKNKSDSNLQRLFNFKPNSLKTAANELARFQKELDDLGKDLGRAQKEVSGFAFGITNLKKGGALASTATTQGLDNFATQGDITSSVNARGKGFKGGQKFEPAFPLSPKIIKASGRRTPQEQKNFLEKKGQGDRLITVEVAGGKLDKIDNITKGGIKGTDPSFGPVPARPRGRDIPGSFGAAFGKTKGRLITQEEFRTTETKQFSPFGGSSAKALGNVGKGKAIGANENSIIIANKELTDLNATLKGTDTVTVNTEKALERARGANGRFVGGLEGLKGTFVQLEATVQKSQATLGNATAGLIRKDDGGRSRAPVGTTLSSGKKIGGQLLPQNKLDATLNPTIDKAAASTAEFTSSVDLTTTAFNENNQAINKNITEHELLEKTLRTYRQSMEKVTTSAEVAARRLATIQAAKASPDARSILSKAPGSNKKGPSKFAKGGFVDGPSHSRGGVPAELEGGEFVVPKAQVDQKKKLPKFAAGDLFKEGEVNPQNKDKIKIQDALVNGIAFIQGPKDSRNSKDPTTGGKVASNGLTLTGKAGKDAGLKNVSKALKNLGYPIEEKGIPSDTKDGVKAFGPYGKYTLNPPNTEDLDEKGINKLFREDAPQAALEAGFKVAFERIAGSVDSSLLKGAAPTFDDLSDENKTRFKEETYDSMKGFMTEAFAAGLSGASLAKSGANFDIEGVTSEQLKKLSLYYDGTNKSAKKDSNAPLLAGSPAKFIEAKTTQKQIENAAPKLTKGYADGQLKGSYTALAKGGLTGEANSLLMPGELVFPPDLVAKVGIEKLREFNKNGDPSVLGNVSGRGIGTVPGSGNTDNFPADLESGSFVIKKSSSKKSGLQKFAGGGLTGTSTSGVERRGDGSRVVRGFNNEIVTAGTVISSFAESGLQATFVLQSLANTDFSSVQGIATAIPTALIGFSAIKPAIDQIVPIFKSYGKEIGLLKEDTKNANSGLDEFTKALNQASTRLYDKNSGGEFFDDFKKKQTLPGEKFSRNVSPREVRGIERVKRREERKGLTRQQRIDRVNRQRGLRLKDPLAAGRVSNKKGITRNSGISKAFGLQSGFNKNSLGKSGFDFGEFAAKGFAKSVKGGLIGTAIGLAASTTLEKFILPELVGASETISGVTGLSSGSVEDAQLAGAITGGTQLAATLGGIGAAFGPVGIAVGAFSGALIGATKGFLDAEKNQKKFNIFKGLKDESDDFTRAVDNLGKKIEAGGPSAIQEAVVKVANEGDQLAKELANSVNALSEFNIDVKKSSEEANFEILGNLFTGEFSNAVRGISQKFDDIQFGVLNDPRGLFTGIVETIGSQSLLGAIRDRNDRAAGRDTTRNEDTRQLQSNAQSFNNLSAALSNIDTQSLKQAETSLFDSIGNIFEENIKNTASLEEEDVAIERLADLGKALTQTSGNFEDTIGVLGDFGDVVDTELVESIQKFQKASNQVKVKELVSKIESLPQVDLLMGTLGDPLTELTKSLGETTDVEKAGEAFKKSLLDSVNVRSLRRQGLLKGNLDISIDELLEKFDKAIDSDNFEKGSSKLKQNLKIVGAALGGTGAEANLLVRELKSLFKSIKEGKSGVVGYEASLAALNLSTERSVEGIRVFTSALDQFSSSISSSVEKLTIAATNTQSDVEKILGNNQEVNSPERFNPFSSAGATQEDINAGTDRLKQAFGKGGFEGLADAASFGNDLPKILKDTANQVKKEGLESGGSQVQTEQVIAAFKDNATDAFKGLPKEVQARFIDKLEKTVSLNRQGSDKNIGSLLDTLAQFGESSELDGLGDEVKSTLASLTDSLNTFEKTIIQSANITLAAAQRQAETQGKLLNREISLQKRLDKFTNTSVDKRQRAEDNLRASLENTATAGGTVALGGTDVLNANSLSQRQKSLEKERDSLRKQIGLGDNPTPGEIREATDGGNQALIKKLGENAAALEGNRKALEALGDDVSRLEAVESELSKIQESRLNQRQRASLFASRIAGAKTSQDQVKVFNEFLKPVIAASKAAQGVALNFGEATALLSDPKIIKDALNLNDQQLEKLLASTTGGIGGAFGRLFGRLSGSGQAGSNLGSRLGGRLFGAGATELGSTKEEIELKKELISLDSDSRKAILETNKLIQIVLLETQTKFAAKVNETASALDDAGEAFDILTKRLTLFIDSIDPKTGAAKPATFAVGGRITGPSHSNGGVDIEAEGGEFIIRKSATSKLQKQMPGLLESLNKGKIPRKMPDGGPTDEEGFNFANFVDPSNYLRDTPIYNLNAVEYLTSGPGFNSLLNSVEGGAIATSQTLSNPKLRDTAGLNFDDTVAPVLEKSNELANLFTPGGVREQKSQLGKAIEKVGSDVINNIDSAIQSKVGDKINDFSDYSLDLFGIKGGTGGLIDNSFQAANAINPLGDDNAIESTVFKKGRKEVANSVEKFYGDVVGGLFSGGNVSKEELLKRSVEQSKEFEASRPDPNRARIGSINERNPDGLAFSSVSGKEQASKPSQTSVQFGSNVLTDKELAQFNPNAESRELGERTKQITSIADEGLLGGILSAEEKVVNALKATGKALGIDTGDYVDRDAEYQNSLKVEEERIRRNKKEEKENPNAFRAKLYEKNIFDAQGNLALRGGDTGFDDGSGSRRSNRLNTTESKLVGIPGIQSPTDFINSGGRADQAGSTRKATPGTYEVLDSLNNPISNFIGNQAGDLDIIERMRNSSTFGLAPEESRAYNDVQNLQSSVQAQQIRDFRRKYNNELGEFDGEQGGISLAPEDSRFETNGVPNERNLNFPDDVNRDSLLQGLTPDSFVAQNRIDYLRGNNISGSDLTDPNADISNEEIIAKQKAKNERLKKERTERVAREEAAAAKKKADAAAKKKQFEDTINPLKRERDKVEKRFNETQNNKFNNVGGVNLNKLSPEQLAERAEKTKEADPRFSKETLARERANLDDFIAGDITEEQFEATRKSEDFDRFAEPTSSSDKAAAKQKVAADTTKKSSKPTVTSYSSLYSPMGIPAAPAAPVAPPVGSDRLSPEEEKASLQRMADNGAQFFGGNNIRPNAKVSEQEQAKLKQKADNNQQFFGTNSIAPSAKVSEQEQAKLKQKADNNQQFFGTNSIAPSAKVSEQEQAKLKQKADNNQQFFGTNSIAPSDPVSQQRQARLVELEGEGAQFVGAGLSKSDPEKRAAAKARRKAQLQERKDAALKGVRGAFRKQQGGTLGQEVQSIDARGQAQDLSMGGADGIARPGQLPSQDLSRGGADGIALANQTPPANLTQLEGNRNARAQAGGATIENNQQFVTVAQELTTASETFSQSIANSVQLLNESPFIQQLTKASEVLSSLPEMKITLNAQVKPVEVILNGGALIKQMKEEAKAEILQAVGEKIANLTNPDGSLNNDSLS